MKGCALGLANLSSVLLRKTDDWLYGYESVRGVQGPLRTKSKLWLVRFVFVECALEMENDLCKIL
jgi:hypothetical protein